MAEVNGKLNIARSYIKTHPEIKHDRTLAKKMYEEMPEVFTSIENARSSIRTATGKVGDRMRKQTKDKSQYKPHTNDTTPPKKQPDQLKEARILILDIETAPISAYVWSLWKQSVFIDQIKNDWFMLTWSAKWLCEKKILSDRLTSAEAKRQDDKRITKNIWALFDEADIIIAHNGDKFDIPAINTRFLKHGLNPPSPFQTIDTLKHLQKTFRFSSNKLDHVNRVLKLRQKINTGGFQLWADCYAGNEEALKKMERYNIHDVKILEETYLLLRPWIRPHPNINLFVLDGQEGCPNCGSRDMKEGGIYRTYANNFRALRCNNCGAVGRRRLSEITVDQKRSILYSVAK